MFAAAKASKQPAAKRVLSAANPRPRYNVPVAFMSSGVVDPYEVEQAVIEPPRQAAAADQPSLHPSIADLPSTRAGLGAEPSSIAMDLEEGLIPAGDCCQLVADLHRDIICLHQLLLSATPKYSTGCTSQSFVPDTHTVVS